jgi:hypothetical protein
MSTVRQENNLAISNESHDILLKKLHSKFNDDQKQLFVQHFVMYLHHHQETAFVIDMDDIWEWLGFARKDNCKRVLEKNFERDSHKNKILQNITKYFFRKLRRMLQSGDQVRKLQ